MPLWHCCMLQRVDRDNIRQQISYVPWTSSIIAPSSHAQEASFMLHGSQCKTHNRSCELAVWGRSWAWIDLLHWCFFSEYCSWLPVSVPLGCLNNFIGAKWNGLSNWLNAVVSFSTLFLTSQPSVKWISKWQTTTVSHLSSSFGFHLLHIFDVGMDHTFEI